MQAGTRQRPLVRSIGWTAVRVRVLDSSAFLVGGRLERADGAINVVADRISPLHLGGRVSSRDFR